MKNEENTPVRKKSPKNILRLTSANEEISDKNRIQRVCTLYERTNSSKSAKELCRARTTEVMSSCAIDGIHTHGVIIAQRKNRSHKAHRTSEIKETNPPYQDNTFHKPRINRTYNGDMCVPGPINKYLGQDESKRIKSRSSQSRARVKTVTSEIQHRNVIDVYVVTVRHISVQVDLDSEMTYNMKRFDTKKTNGIINGSVRRAGQEDENTGILETFYKPLIPRSVRNKKFQVRLPGGLQSTEPNVFAKNISTTGHYISLSPRHFGDEQSSDEINRQNEIPRDTWDERYAQRTMTKSLEYAASRKSDLVNDKHSDMQFVDNRESDRLFSYVETPTVPEQNRIEEKSSNFKKSDVVNLAFINPTFSPDDTKENESIQASSAKHLQLKNKNDDNKGKAVLDLFQIPAKGDGTNGHIDYENECQQNPDLDSQKVETNQTEVSSKTENKDNAKCVEEKPLLFCRLVAEHPVRAFTLTTAFHVISTVIVMVLVLIGSDVFPTDFSSLPLYLFNDITLTRELGSLLRDKYKDRVHRPMMADLISPTWSRGKHIDALVLIYEDVGGGNILTREKLEKIKTAEKRIFEVPEYQSTFCKTQSKLLDCSKPTSIMRLFDGTYGHIDSIFGSNQTADVTDVLNKAYYYNETRILLTSLLSTDSELSPCVRSSMIRSIFYIGWPRLPSENKKTAYDRSALKTFLSNIMKPKIDEIISSELVDISAYYMSVYLTESEVYRQAMEDAKLAMGSLFVILIITWLHTRSVFITCFGLLGILSSFLITNMIYRYILDYKYFGFFHLLSMFIILGIGVDDIFVFADTWRLFQTRPFSSQALRLSRCYKLAAKTTLVTSLTTAFAFAVTAFSPLLCLRSFGIFTGMLVVVNYISVAIHFPTVLLMQEFLCSKLKTCCNRKVNLCNSPRISNYETQGGNLQTFAGGATNSAISSEDKHSIKFTTLEREQTPSTSTSYADSVPRKIRYVTWLLSNRYFSFIKHKRVKLAAPILFASITAFLLVKATNIEKNINQVQLFASTHNYQKAQRKQYDSFPALGDKEFAEVDLLWGVRPSDVSKCSPRSFKPFCHGSPRWDDNFDASSPEAQLALHKLCKKLQNLTEKEATDLRIMRDPVTNKLKISCFTIPFENYMKNVEDRMVPETGVPYYPSDMHLRIPLDSGNMTTFMERNPLLYDVSTLPPNFDRYLETAIAYWLSNGYTFVPTEDFVKFHELIGEVIDPKMTRSIKTVPVVYYGTRLKYISIRIVTDLRLIMPEYKETLLVMERWESLMQNAMSEMPDSLKGGFQTARQAWHLLKVQESVEYSAKLGLALGLSFALVILVLLTWNLIVGVLATLTIAMVTACSIGIMSLAGWSLGALESLSICLAVGLAVDYIVHIAEAYNMSVREKREERVQDALETVGMSVITGAVTTFGASLFMLFGKIQFIYKLGVFIMSLVGLSITFSLFCFTPILCVCGPEGSFGSLTSIFQLCKYVCCCTKLGRKSTCKRKCQLVCAATITGEIPSVDGTIAMASDRRIRNYEM